MSDSKMLFGLLIMFSLIVMMFSSMAIGKCKETYAAYGEFDFKEPEGAWLPALDYALSLMGHLISLVGSILSPCSGLGWLTILVLVPIAVVIIYLGILALPTT